MTQTDAQAMDGPPPDFRLLRFWSDDFPLHQRVEAWRSVLSRKLLRVEVEAISPQPFQVDASLRIIPGLRFGIGLFGPSISRRTRPIVTADNDDFYILVNLEGALTVEHGGSEARLEEGDACFMSCAQEANFIRPGVGRLLCARLPRKPLAALIPELDDCVGRVVRRESESLRLFCTYLRGLDDNQGLETPELRRAVVDQINELTALVLNPLVEGAIVNRGRSAVRLRAIKGYIADNLERQELSVGDVAAAHRLSSRQVQRFFEAEGLTFSEFLLAKRLQRVHAILSDPRQLHRGVSEMALAAGFGDVSYFNRAFRRHYGASPTQVRAAASEAAR